MISKKAWSVSTHAHQHEEGKNEGILSLNSATLIIAEAHMLHLWAEINI